MKKTWRISIRRAFELGTAIGVVGLTACDDGTATDGSVFERDGSRIAPTESVVQNLPVSDAGLEDILGVLRDPDAFSRARRLGTLLPTMGPGPAEHIAGIFSDLTLTLHLGATEVELLSRYWATHDPEAASTWAVKRSAPAYRTAAVFSTMPVWAEADPFAALEAGKRWAERGDVRDAMQASLIMGWYAGGDTPELHAFMQQLGIGFSRQRSLSAYVRVKLRTEGVDAVMRWAEGLSDDDPMYKLAAYRQVGFGVAPYDLKAALSWCDAHCQGPYGTNLRGSVVQGWMQSDPPAALKWISDAPEGHERGFALRVAHASWLRADRDAAMQWIAEQTPDGPSTALAPTYPNYAPALAEESPARAIPFAELIEDEVGRENLLVEIATVWRAQDEAACEAWLEQSPLSEEARQNVRGRGTPVAEPTEP
jgi:hypothetical protein